MRIAEAEGRSETDLVESPRDAQVRVAEPNRYGLAEDAVHGLARMERSEGILEDHLQAQIVEGQKHWLSPAPGEPYHCTRPPRPFGRGAIQPVAGRVPSLPRDKWRRRESKMPPSMYLSACTAGGIPAAGTGCTTGR